jgi:hypothetical protein
MPLKEETEKIFKKEMNRKQFLQHMGLFLLAIFGVNTLISRFLHPQRHMPGSDQKSGWGNGKFGV